MGSGCGHVFLEQPSALCLAFGCVCTLLQSYYYSSFKQTQGSLKQINLGSSSRPAAGLRFHCLNIQPELGFVCFALRFLWLWLTYSCCCRGTSGGSLHATVIPDLLLWIVFSLLRCKVMNFNKFPGMKGKRAALVRQVFIPCMKWTENGMLMMKIISSLVAGLLQPDKEPPTGIYLQIPHVDMSHSDLLNALGLVITCPSKGSY